MTYQELQEYVRERLGIDSGDTSRSTLIQRVLNSEYTQACLKSEATLATTAVSFTSGTATVSLGASVEKVKAIFTATGRLIPVSASRFAFLAGTYLSAADRPSAPAYYIVTLSGAVLQIRMWPTPTVTDATPLAFTVSKPTALSANGDIPSAIPDAWHHSVIGERTVMNLALADGEVALAEEARALADQGLGELVQHIRDRHGELEAMIYADADVGVPLPARLGQGAPQR